MSLDRDLRTNFTYFSSRVSAIYNQNPQSIDSDLATPPNLIHGYLGAGTEYNIYRLDTNYIARLPHSPENDIEDTIANSVEALKRGIGQRGLQQIVAYSDSETEPAIICEYAPGKPLSAISSELDGIPNYHYEDLLQSYIAMQELGLRTDPVPENTLYCPGNSFTTIDYDYDLDSTQTLQDKVITFASRDVLLKHLSYRPLDRMPSYALRFQKVVANILGSGTSQSIQDNWDSDEAAIRESYKKHGRS